MLKNIILIIFFSFYNFQIYAFEPYSGISCHSDSVKGKEEYFFKHDENHIYATAYKRVNGQFIKVGNVVGQKVSSFLLFEIFFSKEIKSEGSNIRLANIANNKVVETSPPNAIVPP